MASCKVTVETDARICMAILRVIRYASPLLGERLSWRLAALAARTVRWRIGRGKWRRLGVRLETQ